MMLPGMSFISLTLADYFLPLFLSPAGDDPPLSLVVVPCIENSGRHIGVGMEYVPGRKCPRPSRICPLRFAHLKDPGSRAIFSTSTQLEAQKRH